VKQKLKGFSVAAVPYADKHTFHSLQRLRFLIEGRMIAPLLVPAALQHSWPEQLQRGFPSGTRRAISSFL
jgi:hypothetical protein